MEKTKNKQSLSYVVKTMFAGGIAGCCAKSVIAPLDRVKILFQTNNPEYIRYSGSVKGTHNAIKSIYQEYGLRGLFQGHSATLLRIFPYAAIKFMAYEQYKFIIMPTKDKETPFRRTLAGSMAGVTSVFFSYPLDLLRVRLAFLVNKKTSIKSTFVQIYNEPINPVFKKLPSPWLGITNFYRGFLPTLWGMIPYAGFSFLTYETMKSFFMGKSWIASFAINNDTKKLRPWAYLTAGAVSGAIAQTASYPLEVVRRRMQVAGVDHVHLDTLSTVGRIYCANGFRGFFVGLSIGYMKIVPMFAVSFFVYEKLKALLDVE